MAAGRREAVEVRSERSGSWMVYSALAEYGGRCCLCQRGHRAGTRIYLGHGQPICPTCVRQRPAEVADRVAFARGARSRTTGEETRRSSASELQELMDALLRKMQR